MAVNKAERDEKKTETKPKKGLREKLPQILLWTFLGANLTIMVGSMALIYKVKIGTHRDAITEASETILMAQDREIRANNPVLFSFDPFTVNLDGRPRKIVRTTIQLEMLSEEGYEEAVNLGPVARDEIVKILNSKKYEDIDTIQGKLFLKDQILTSLNGMMHRGSVKEVYFGDFTVQ